MKQMKQKVEDKGQRGEAIMFGANAKARGPKAGNGKHPTSNIQHPTSNGEGPRSAMVPAATSYEESAAGQRRAAVAEDIQVVNRLQKEIVLENGAVLKSVVRMFNWMRRQGEALQRIAGREQLTFAQFQPVQDQLPFDFETAKKRIALTCRHPEDIAQWEQLGVDTQKQLMLEMQLLAVRDGQMSPLLGPGGAPQTTGAFTLFLHDVTRMKQPFLKALRAAGIEDPSESGLQQFMAKQSAERLNDFVADTEWLVTARTAATRLLHELH